VFHTLVKAAINTLKLGDASGPDGHPACLFEKPADSLAEPLSLMFTSFMSTSLITEEWKHALMI